VYSHSLRASRPGTIRREGGNVYYNVIKYDRAVALPTDPAPNRARFVDSWLVKVSSAAVASKVRYSDLMAPANPPTPCRNFEPQFDVGTSRG